MYSSEDKAAFSSRSSLRAKFDSTQFITSELNDASSVRGVSDFILFMIQVAMPNKIR